MTTRRVVGLAPYLPDRRPRAAARWWIAAGVIDAETLRIDSLDESESLPVIDPGVAIAVAAPCSLPAAFVEHLKVSGEPGAILASIEKFTPARLLRETRRFAARRKRGDRYPRRDVPESASALERDRLPLFRATVPLLRKRPDARELDSVLFLRSRDLPSSSLSGAAPAAVRARALILERLAGCEAVRDLAIASFDGLRAILAAHGAL